MSKLDKDIAAARKKVEKHMDDNPDKIQRMAAACDDDEFDPKKKEK